MDQEIPPDVARALQVVNAEPVADGVWHGRAGGKQIEIRAPWAPRPLEQTTAAGDADADVL